MVQFTAVISDPKTGKSYQTVVSGHHANSLIGKKIGDEFDGIFVGLPGYKLVVRGGSDRDGFPMRRDLPGPKRRRVLVSRSTGYRMDEPGVRRRRHLRGGTISPDIVQINLRISAHGSKPIEDALKAKGEQPQAAARRA
ncbi:MAG: 30S ribosomal protein S6e [Thermoplasmatota archaeon]